MITDHLFYDLFETSPETLFLALGTPVEEAHRIASKYQFVALEFKETSHRADGVFQPKETGLPVYFLETQYYWLRTVYADILAKAFTYLKQNDPGQEFFAVVLFGTRALEPEILTPYQSLLDSGQLRRIFLNELPDVPDAPLGLSILRMIGQRPEPATVAARSLIARTKSEISDLAARNSLLQLIETVIIYKLPDLSREDIQAMIEVSDIRETRVFQEALEEGLEKGREEGIEKGREEGIEEGIEKGIEKGLEKGLEKGREEERARTLQEKLEAIPKLAARGLPAGEIADVLKLEMSQIRQALEQQNAD